MSQLRKLPIKKFRTITRKLKFKIKTYCPKSNSWNEHQISSLTIKGSRTETLQNGGSDRLILIAVNS